jgi:hypothetical protein
MSKLPDPARDFTDLCLSLRSANGRQSGAEMLASRFVVGAWSTDFMLIMASIHQRIESLREMIIETELDDDIKTTAFGCLEGVRAAFSVSGLTNLWQHSIDNFLTDANLTPIRMTSGYVRVRHGYYVPDDEEMTELLAEIESLIDWLKTIDIIEKDFVRRALIEGLEGFRFRITRVGYFGWPASFESLKAVITAYMALERAMPNQNESPPYEAIVKKTGDFLLKMFERIKFAKEVSETSDWLLRGYGALQAIGHLQPSIAGLLTRGSS